MLNENLKAFRKAKGISQEELAARLYVVRQTLSKWERGLSVPDADMLIRISEVLETPVSTLLGETALPEKADDIQSLSEKLESINLQLANRKALRQRVVRWALILLLAGTAAGFAALAALGSPYLSWDYGDPEKAVLGVALHGVEWFFVRLAPVVLAASAAGLFVMWKKR